MALFTGNEKGIHSAFEHLIGQHQGRWSKTRCWTSSTSASPVKMVDEVVGWLKQNGGGANGSAPWPRDEHANKVPYVWGGAVPSGWDC